MKVSEKKDIKEEDMINENIMNKLEAHMEHIIEERFRRIEKVTEVRDGKEDFMKKLEEHIENVIETKFCKMIEAMNHKFNELAKTLKKSERVKEEFEDDSSEEEGEEEEEYGDSEEQDDSEQEEENHTEEKFDNTEDANEKELMNDVKVQEKMNSRSNEQSFYGKGTKELDGMTSKFWWQKTKEMLNGDRRKLGKVSDKMLAMGKESYDKELYEWAKHYHEREQRHLGEALRR